MRVIIHYTQTHALIAHSFNKAHCVEASSCEGKQMEEDGHASEWLAVGKEGLMDLPGFSMWSLPTCDPARWLNTPWLLTR